MLILNFTYPLRCLRVPLGVSVPPVEYHWSSGFPLANRIRVYYVENTSSTHMESML
jgi:hypothetical protein